MSDVIVYDSIYHPIPAHTTIDTFIGSWLHGRPASTQEVYSREAYRFLFFLGEEKTLQEATLLDVQDFADTLSYLKPATKARILNVIKSLYSFAQKTGYLTYNIGAVIKPPKVHTRLAERILTEEEVNKIIILETNTRNHALLRFLYLSGARVSEVCNLIWQDFQDRDKDMGQVTIIGKGEKERVVLLPASLYQEVLHLKEKEGPVFCSRGANMKSGGGPLDASQAHRIVKAAAIRAGVQVYEEGKTRVSAHFFRHAHVSHALDRGVPAHVVMTTVGHASLKTTTDYSHARPDTSSALKLSA